MPAKVNDINISIWEENNIECMDDAEISISESAFEDFLYPVLMNVGATNGYRLLSVCGP